MLENAVIVAWALVIGGFAILLVERFAKTRDVGGVANVSARQSILVGLVQCIAMIPGVSRSGATILGAMSFGVDRKTAAERSEERRVGKEGVSTGGSRWAAYH